jgi:hypothetical protein
MDICIDFDGTCVKHEFPNIGQEIPMAVQTMKDLVAKGHNIILFTMRSMPIDLPDNRTPIRRLVGRKINT